MNEQDDNQTQAERLKAKTAIVCAAFFILWAAMFFAVKIYGTNPFEMLREFSDLGYSAGELKFWVLALVFVMLSSPILYLPLITASALAEGFPRRLTTLARRISGFGTGTLTIVWVLVMASKGKFLSIDGMTKRGAWVFLTVHTVLVLVLLLVPARLQKRLSALREPENINSETVWE